jgi:hypothetical protein
MLDEKVKGRRGIDWYWGEETAVAGTVQLT